MSSQTNNELHQLSTDERLQAYKYLTSGCSHLFSKGKLQEDKLMPLLSNAILLAKNDPIFLAHLLSYVIKKSDSKDLRVVLTYANFLSDGDGSLFSPGSKYKKPNLRIISSAAIQNRAFEPKLVDRVAELASIKFGVKKDKDIILREAKHKPGSLKTAIKKWIKYRENNLNVVDGLKRAGLGKTMQKLYHRVQKAPTDQVASILRWQQKDGRKIEMKKSQFDFNGMQPIEIAKKIQDEKLSVLGEIGELTRETPPVAVALLEQATPNQGLILRKTFEDTGVLKDKEVLKLYEDKINQASGTIDRVKKISKEASDEVKKIMKKAKSNVRKKTTGDIGKIYMHLDISGSMDEAIDFARDSGAIIAECVKDPQNNFMWGAYEQRYHKLPFPESFEEDAFKAALYGITSLGCTDCFATYKYARKFGADVDVHLTDQGHNVGDLAAKIRNFHQENPDISKPKACVIVHFSNYDEDNIVQVDYENNMIPVTVIDPKTLTSSNMVSESIKTAMLGPTQVIDEILNTKLLELPEWYYSV